MRPRLSERLSRRASSRFRGAIETMAGTAYLSRPAISNDVLELGRSVAMLGRPDRGVSPCSRCHGPSGIGVAPYFPALMGQDAGGSRKQGRAPD
jgi:cytochrome c553